jgi:hypothetical protein
MAQRRALLAALGTAGAPTLLVLILCGELFGESSYCDRSGSPMLLQVPWH